MELVLMYADPYKNSHFKTCEAEDGTLFFKCDLIIAGKNWTFTRKIRDTDITLSIEDYRDKHFSYAKLKEFNIALQMLKNKHLEEYEVSRFIPFTSLGDREKWKFNIAVEKRICFSLVLNENYIDRFNDIEQTETFDTFLEYEDILNLLAVTDEIKENCGSLSTLDSNDWLALKFYFGTRNKPFRILTYKWDVRE